MKDATIVYGMKLLISLELEERHKVICLDKFNDLEPKNLESIFSQKCFQKCSFILIQIELPINTTSMMVTSIPKDIIKTLNTNINSNENEKT